MIFALFTDCLQTIFCTLWALSKAFCIIEARKEVLPFDKK